MTPQLLPKMCDSVALFRHLIERPFVFHFCPKSYNFHLPSISFPLHLSVSSFLPLSTPKDVYYGGKKKINIVASDWFVFSF